MTRQLAIPGSVDAPAALARQLAYARAAEEALRHVRDWRSDRTRKAYKVQWEAWGRYCADREIEPLPVDAGELVTFLEWRSASGSAPNSVRLALAAISTIDKLSRVTPTNPDPNSVGQTELVRTWLKGWSKEHPKRPRKQAPALEPNELEQILRAAAERGAGVSAAQHTAAYARDRAMILLGVAGALRVSELVALDVGDVLRVERGLRLLVRRSKVDQHGEGHLRAIVPQARVIRCPVDAWRCWMAVRGDAPGPAFVAIQRSGELGAERLTESSARRIVARRAAAVGLELVTSHSMRATFATLAAARGKGLHKLADHGGWRGLDVLRGYIRQGELFDDPATAGLLDD